MSLMTEWLIRLQGKIFFLGIHKEMSKGTTTGAAGKDVILYCESRERFLAAQRLGKEERTEQANAQRTIGNLLIDSMKRNDVKCIHVRNGCLSPGNRRTTIDDSKTWTRCSRS